MQYWPLSSLSVQLSRNATLLALAAAWLVLNLTTNPAQAWGTQGHQVVANLAQAQLSVGARREVDRLLATEPGQTMASISTWADEHRNPATAPWHYVNFPKSSCTYSAERDCPDGQCVVAAIDRQTIILAAAGSDASRLRALKYLVHLQADVHQPLHAGYAKDRGGNSYQLQTFMRASNLHAVWDSGLIRALDQDTEVMTARLLVSGRSDKSLALAHGHAAGSTAVLAAEESCRIVGLAGFYPGRLVDLAYVQRFTPLMEQRLQQAGARLAVTLNQALPESGSVLP
jgi:hypothetical protein